MRTSRATGIGSLLLSVWLCVPAMAQEPKVAPKPLGEVEAGASETQLLRAALTEVVELLKQSLEMQEVGVLLRRLELTEARIAPLRAEVGTARRKLASIEEDKLGLDTEIERMNQVIFNMEGEEDEEGNAVDLMKYQRRHAKERLELLGRQEAEARQALYDLESELDRELTRIQALNEWVDERLGL